VISLTALSHLLIDSFSIVLIDLLLAGDNALVIAMAVRSLPPQERRMGSLLGAAGAVALRVMLTAAAAEILNIAFLKLLGGAFVLWIAVKVFSDASAPQRAEAARGRLLQAVWFIIFADITMSTDNVLAIAGASHGNLALIVFGLCLSIPLVVFSSNLIALVMDRYPAMMYLGAAILGKVGAEMMLSDPFIAHKFHLSEDWQYAAQTVAVVGVLIASRAMASSKSQAEEVNLTQP
jgi:YjbE family integral membrane protein